MISSGIIPVNPLEDTHVQLGETMPVAEVYTSSNEARPVPIRSSSVYSDESSDPSIDDGRTRVVKFKTGKELVAFQAPPRYFIRRDTKTSDSVIQLYKESCEKYKVKPIQTLIKTIQESNISLGERIARISFRGEKLDVRIVESLEDVFRHVQCEVLDLENTYLEDQTASALFDMIEFYETAHRIRIGSNHRISAHCWMYVYQLLRKSPFITQLDCENSDFIDNSMSLFARALRNGCNLVTLHIEHCRLTGRHLLILASGLKTNLVLRELFLGSNDLVPPDGMQLGNLLKFNTRLELLDVRNNKLSDTGIAYICEGLKEQTDCRGLTTLMLWNNHLTPFACEYLSHCLITNSNLQTLEVGSNDLRNEGIIILKEGFLRNKSLLRVGLVSTKFESEGAIALAEFVADSRRLVRLDIRANNIRVAGSMALAHAMKVNFSVVRLDVEEVARREGLKDYQSVYHEFYEQLQAQCKRNRTRAEDENNRRLMIQKQVANQHISQSIDSPTRIEFENTISIPNTSDAVILLPPRPFEMNDGGDFFSGVPLPLRKEQLPSKVIQVQNDGDDKELQTNNDTSSDNNDQVLKEDTAS